MKAVCFPEKDHPEPEDPKAKVALVQVKWVGESQGGEAAVPGLQPGEGFGAEGCKVFKDSS